jgi:hypothetical protein
MVMSGLQSALCATSKVTPLFRFSCLSLTTAGLVALSLPAHAAFNTVSSRDYASCAAGLLRAGVSEADAASACAEALQPRDISSCVSDIRSEANSLAAADVLSACRRVRRPDALASCFTDIKASDNTAALADVLDNCRRSLMPDRFSACVRGLRNEIKLSTAAAMETCVTSGGRP